MTNGKHPAGFKSALASRSNVAARRPALIAVLESSLLAEAALVNRLRELGHCPVAFPHLERFLSVSQEGVRFDLVLTPPLGPLPWQHTLAACRASRVPVVVLAQEFQLAQLTDVLAAARRSGPESADLDFAVLPTTDMELACRIDLSLHPQVETTAAGRPANQRFGPYCFNLVRRRVTLRGADCNLTPREFQVALALFENAGQVIERELMHRILWGQQEPSGRSRALDMYVSKLRRKLDLCEANGFELISIHKRGYELLQLLPETSWASFNAAATAASAIPRGAKLELPGVEVVPELSASGPAGTLRVKQFAGSAGLPP